MPTKARKIITEPIQTAQNSYVGHDGDLTINPLTGQLVYHDGATVGGHVIVPSVGLYEREDVTGVLTTSVGSVTLVMSFNKAIYSAVEATVFLSEVGHSSNIAMSMIILAQDGTSTISTNGLAFASATNLMAGHTFSADISGGVFRILLPANPFGDGLTHQLNYAISAKLWKKMS